MMEEKVLSRRKVLKGAGISLAGVALMGGMGTLLTGCAQGSAEEPAQPGNAPAPEWPLTYEPVDVDKAELLAYDSYIAGHG